ncbi:hypothetical protein PG999_000236 [Apiospora kogelbergensis]|uniref:DUF6924 domain-containing protein n=1 Tax=Apiospora kogelbergensis TaxID=1337665 RepID=A0AAW0RB61_9PEZI
MSPFCLKVLSRLLTDALAGSNDLAPGSEPELAIVEIQDGGTSRVPSHATTTPLEESFRAFVAASVDDAAKYHVGGASYFALLDEQSSAEEEKTVLLVSRCPDGTIEGTARVTFESAQFLLTSLAVASIGFTEIQSIGASQGGVYGRSKEAPKKGEPGPRKRLGG